MHVIVSGIGSAGDVNPFIEIARELVTRGHEVDFIASPYFEEKLKLSKLNLVPFGTREQFLETATDPEMWHPRRGFAATWRALKESLRIHYQLIAERHKRGKTVLLNSTIAMGGRLAQEKLHIPAATVHLAPSCILSADAPPHFPGLTIPMWLPHPIRRAIMDMVDRFGLDSVCAEDLNAVRSELGLAPVSHVFGRWLHSPDLVIGAFPEWFAPIKNDWPANSVLTGFPVHQTSGREKLSAELERFLDNGASPVAFTAGSAMGNPREYFMKAVEVVRRSGVRAIFVSVFTDQVRDLLPPDAIHVEYAPFDQLLPRVSVLAHHGGIGTSAQALAAGTAQLILPFAHDQFDNADRFRGLNVADTGSVRDKPERLALKLTRLLKDEQVAEACARYRKKVEETPDPRVRTCELLEALHARMC